jgi:hypothetical protein
LLPWLNAGAFTARQHSVSRDAALIALRERELVWQIVYTSPSLTVSAPLPWLVSRSRRFRRARLSPDFAFSAWKAACVLPALEFAIFERKRPDAAAAALTAVLVSLGQTAIRPTAG